MKNFYLTLIISIVTVINPILCAKAEGVKYSALPLGAPVDASCTTVLSDDTESINHSALPLCEPYDESCTTMLSVNTEFVSNFTLPLGAPVDESCTNGNKGEAAFGIEIISEASENTTTIIDKNKKPTIKKQKIGLALSGGGALGFAHIGAIQALEEHGVKPDFISGSSMGAIIGVIYCAGYTPTEIMKVIKNEKLYKLEKLMSPKISLKRQGLSSHATLRTTLQEMLPHDCFDSLKIPFTVCVTNITSGKSEYYFSGKGLINWVVASASIPGVFEPVFVNDTAYVDGGVLNNLPAEALHNRGCDYIIGVDVLPFLDVQKSSIMDIALWSIRLMQHSNTIDDSKYCNWLITSNAIKSYNEFDFDKYKEIYQYGYKAMTEYIHSHPEMVETITGKPTEHHHPATTNAMKQITK